MICVGLVYSLGEASFVGAGREAAGLAGRWWVLRASHKGSTAGSSWYQRRGFVPELEPPAPTTVLHTSSPLVLCQSWTGCSHVVHTHWNRVWFLFVPHGSHLEHCGGFGPVNATPSVAGSGQFLGLGATACAVERNY